MRKAQAWGFDLIVATGIFMVGMTIFFLYTLNYPKGTGEEGKDLEYDATKIAENLLSEGLPTDWNNNSVIKIGMMTDHKINQTKLEKLYYFSTNQYQKSREIFGTKYKYFINASVSLTINGTSIYGIGAIPLNEKNLYRASRVSIYNGKPINLEVSVWE